MGRRFWPNDMPDPDNYITGNYGQDQFAGEHECPVCGHCWYPVDQDDNDCPSCEQEDDDGND